MTGFPETRHSLIRELAVETTHDGWREFLADYWGPVTRFASRWGRLGPHDAEDVASDTFEIVIRKGLLARWAHDRRSKLRTLVCSVVRKVLANRQRRAARGNVVDGYDVANVEEATGEQLDSFYAGWVEELLRACVDELMLSYHSEDRGDYFRVLHGRICEGMPNREVAAMLSRPVTDVENFYRHARSRLQGLLETRVREMTRKYSLDEPSDDEFTHEWRTLGDYLERHGGLERILRESTESANGELGERRRKSITRLLELNVGPPESNR